MGVSYKTRAEVMAMVDLWGIGFFFFFLFFSFPPPPCLSPVFSLTFAFDQKQKPTTITCYVNNRCWK